MFLLSALLTARLVAAAEDGSEATEPVDDPYALDVPRWIQHRVTPGERLVFTAVRFGVTPQEVSQWNDLPPHRQRLPVGSRLRIQARRLPPERERKVHVVEPGESWTEIAVQYRIDRRRLRAYNWRKKSLKAGDEVSLWIDPGRRRTVNVRPGPPLPAEIEVEPGGYSVGRPQVGRIKHAVQLPESPWYTRGDPEWLWGSSHTILYVQKAMALFRHRTGYRGEVVIGAISRRKGRRFPPHRSHQSGRDVDVRLPLLPGLGPKLNPHPDEVDWPAAWELVRAFLDTEQVQFVFLERKLQRRLYEAARWEGESRETLAELIDWVDGRRTAPVRHAAGHDGHIHVRIKCAPDEPSCR